MSVRYKILLGVVTMAGGGCGAIVDNIRIGGRPANFMLIVVISNIYHPNSGIVIVRPQIVRINTPIRYRPI